MHVSLLFSGGFIVDGSGNSRYQGVVAVKDDTIIYCGSERGDITADVTIDCTGKIITPGFIDMHGHSELHVLSDSHMSEKILQGITTEVFGNCGLGIFPIASTSCGRSLLEQMTSNVLGTGPPSWSWNDLSSYADYVQNHGSYTHLSGLQAHAPLRIAHVSGNPNRAATTKEINAMCTSLNLAYDQGACGFSTGLYYAPCFFAHHDELSALLEVTANRNRLFSVHHRCEGDFILDSLREVLELAIQVGVRTEISHLKVIGERNQHLVPEVLALIESYEAKGLDVGFDQYPYTFGSTSLYSLLPPSYLQLSKQDLQAALQDSDARSHMKEEMINPKGWDSVVSLCGWDAISVMHIDGKPELQGTTFAQLAERAGTDAFTFLFNLLAELPETAVMADVTQSEQSLCTILRHRLGCFGTDALYSGSVIHQRSYEAVPHLLTHYSSELQVMSLEKLIARMTSVPAHRLRIPDRGLLKPGHKADIVILNGDTVESVITDGVMICNQGELIMPASCGVIRSQSD